MSLPYKTILTIDWETRWSSSDYTLSKMTTEAYIRDPRFHAYGLCIHEYGTDKITQWYSHKEVEHILSMYDWTKTAVLAHNSLFDVGILSMIYGVQPCFVFDSLSMARALRGVEVGNSLAKLAMAFDLPPKGRAVHSTDGIEEITPEIERELAEYCKHDVFLCEEIFTRLCTGLHGGGRIGPAYPTKELRLIDLTLKMFTAPQLVLDVPMLEKARDEENEKLRAALARVGVEESQLASNDQFAEILEKMGVMPPTKKKRPTLKTPNPIGENFAFAKNDAHFQQMLNGDNEDVALLCEARLRVKSTLERTRSQRFIDIAGRGALPIPLKYYGAETGRWSGCLVAETEVIVYNSTNGQCTKHITDVLPDDLVWDGVEFVQHEGVKFSGYMEVITYDGVTGTADHKVFIDEDTTYSLHDAQARGANIMDAAKPDVGAVESARRRLSRIRW